MAIHATIPLTFSTILSFLEPDSLPAGMDKSKVATSIFARAENAHRSYHLKSYDKYNENDDVIRYEGVVYASMKKEVRHVKVSPLSMNEWNSSLYSLHMGIVQDISTCNISWNVIFRFVSTLSSFPPCVMGAIRDKAGHILRFLFQRSWVFQSINIILMRFQFPQPDLIFKVLCLSSLRH